MSETGNTAAEAPSGPQDPSGSTPSPTPEPASTEPTTTAAGTAPEPIGQHASGAILEDDSNLPYTVGSWAGKPNYQCRYCPQASVDLDWLLEHIVQTHIPEPRWASGLLGADGKPLVTGA